MSDDAEIISREERLEAALREIAEDAPTIEPKPDLRCANDGQMEDAGYDRARREMAEIARKALQG